MREPLISESPLSASPASGSPSCEEKTANNSVHPDLATVKNRFVNVQLTLLSIAVALILENLLGVLHEAPVITPLILVQSIEIGISAISMWVGFAYGISSVNKPPHLMDFLVHFLLLFTLSTAVTFIGTGNLPGYFIASGLGSASAALCLRLDVVLAHRAGQLGPSGTFRLLAWIAGIELAIGLLALTMTLTAAVAMLLLIPVMLLQGIAALRSIRAWQDRLAPSSPQATSDAT